MAIDSKVSVTAGGYGVPADPQARSLPHRGGACLRGRQAPAPARHAVAAGPGGTKAES